MQDPYDEKRKGMQCIMGLRQKEEIRKISKGV